MHIDDFREQKPVKTICDIARTMEMLMLAYRELLSNVLRYKHSTKRYLDAFC